MYTRSREAIKIRWERAARRKKQNKCVSFLSLYNFWKTRYIFSSRQKSSDCSLTLGPKETSLKMHSMVKRSVKSMLKLDLMSWNSKGAPWKLSMSRMVLRTIRRRMKFSKG